MNSNHFEKDINFLIFEIKWNCFGDELLLGMKKRTLCEDLLEPHRNKRASNLKDFTLPLAMLSRLSSEGQCL